MASTCRISLLGGFRAEIDGRDVPDEAWRHRRAADLVKLLALAPEHRLHREQVMDALWRHLEPDRAAANLRKAVHYARRALASPDAISTRGEMVSLWREGTLVIDAEVFDAAARHAIASGAEVCVRTAELFGGELLPEDRFAEWTEPHRERLRGRYLTLLRSCGMWERVLEFDRADEDAHRALMRAYLEAGNRRAVILQFERLRDVLRVDLGVGPEEETVALYERAFAMEGREPAAPAEHAQALIARGLVYWNRQDLDEAERVAGQARALAIDAALGRELGEACALLGLVAWARGRWPEVFRLEFLEAIRRTPALARWVFDAHLCFAESSLYGPHGSQTIVPLAQELLRAAEVAGSIPGQAVTTLLLAEVELFSGRVESAERTFTRAGELSGAAGATSGQTLSLLGLAETARVRGRRDESVRLLRSARRLAETSELVSHLLVRVLGAQIEAARSAKAKMSMIDEAERALLNRPVCGPCSIGHRVAASVGCAGSGDVARARRYLAEVERLAGMWQGGPWLAATWEARAALRRAEGDPAQAAALYREAATLFAQVGRPLDAGRCRATASHHI